MLVRPDGKARWLFVLGPGAGGGMRQPLLEGMARALAAHGVASYRYEFRSMDKRAAEARVREALGEAAAAAPDLPVLAGGKSFGGRMTSQAQAREPLPGVRGLVFLGFPLHPPGRPGTDRADHLSGVRIPMLFLQGTRDQFAGLELLRPVVERLGAHATLHLLDGGDHSFKTPRRAAGDVIDELAGVIVGWSERILGEEGRGRGEGGSVNA